MTHVKSIKNTVIVKEIIKKILNNNLFTFDFLHETSIPQSSLYCIITESGINTTVLF